MLDDDDDDEPATGDGVVTAKMRVTPPPVERTQTDEPLPTARLTRCGIVIGSAPYMSPEQWGTRYAVGLQPSSTRSVASPMKL